MSEPPKPGSTPDRSLRTILLVGGWGAATVLVAYLISRGNLAVFVGVMLLIGIAQRVAAVYVVRRHGETAPPWWRI